MSVDRTEFSFNSEARVQLILQAPFPAWWSLPIMARWSWSLAGRVPFINKHSTVDTTTLCKDEDFYYYDNNNNDNTLYL